jgi:hypothetical protein
VTLGVVDEDDSRAAAVDADYRVGGRGRCRRVMRRRHVLETVRAAGQAMRTAEIVAVAEGTADSQGNQAGAVDADGRFGGGSGGCAEGGAGRGRVGAVMAGMGAGLRIRSRGVGGVGILGKVGDPNVSAKFEGFLFFFLESEFSVVSLGQTWFTLGLSSPIISTMTIHVGFFLVTGENTSS